jgi:hypothetical protein
MTDASRACEFYPDDDGRTIACDVASGGRMGWAPRKCFERCDGHTCGSTVGDIYQDLQHSICRSLNDKLAPRCRAADHAPLCDPTSPISIMPTETGYICIISSHHLKVETEK